MTINHKIRHEKLQHQEAAKIYALLSCKIDKNENSANEKNIIF